MKKSTRVPSGSRTSNGRFRPFVIEEPGELHDRVVALAYRLASCARYGW